VSEREADANMTAGLHSCHVRGEKSPVLACLISCYPARTLAGSMTENKTKATTASVDAFINSLPEPRRADVQTLAKLLQSVSRQKPKMWGPSIIGCGSYHYRYESGREGDAPLLCFSPRKSANVIYICLSDKSPLNKLGKHKLTGGCLHIKKLSDVDPAVLKVIMADSYANMRKQHTK
jgi:hypothetical protein